MSDDLKPCPFCGCTTIHRRRFPGYELHYFECDWCGAEGPAEAPDEDPPQGWNYRADTAEVIALRARVAAAEKLAELVRLVHGSFGGGLLMTFDERDPAIFAEALAAYEAAK